MLKFWKIFSPWLEEFWLFSAKVILEVNVDKREKDRQRDGEGKSLACKFLAKEELNFEIYQV